MGDSGSQIQLSSSTFWTSTWFISRKRLSWLAVSWSNSWKTTEKSKIIIFNEMPANDLHWRFFSLFDQTRLAIRLATFVTNSSTMLTQIWWCPVWTFSSLDNQADRLVPVVLMCLKRNRLWILWYSVRYRLITLFQMWSFLKLTSSQSSLKHFQFIGPVWVLFD